MSEYIIELPDKPANVVRDGWNVRIEWQFKQREEIVRCRDCKHARHESNWQPDKRRKPIDLWLCGAEWCEGLDGDSPWVKPDGFCAWGERRG